MEQSMDSQVKIEQLIPKLSEQPTKKKPLPSLQPQELIEGYKAFDDPDRATVKTHSREGDCPECGFEPGVPGYILHPLTRKKEQCPTCYNKNISIKQKITGQLEGVLKLKTFDTFLSLEGSEQALKAVREWVDKPVGWCTLWGSYGPGKTHLAAAVTNYLGKDTALYLNFPDLTSMIRNDAAKAYQLIQKIKRYLTD